MKYKLDSKKYRKSDVDKYKNISNKILQSESPDCDFCMKRLDVFMHILDSR